VWATIPAFVCHPSCHQPSVATRYAPRGHHEEWDV